MSDAMHPLSLPQLFTICFEELQQLNSIFGIHKDSFYRPEHHPHLQFSRYGKLLESPLGVAAGPQTQLSQNIISSWLTGSRYIELKTVQTLDELEVSKPCIDMEDEGYNCEWSQELKLEQSFSEYLNAWIMIHILKAELNIGVPGEVGTIFNMSVGYNMEGILNPNVQKFFRQMEGCPEELQQAMDLIRPLYPNIDKLNIPQQISDNITLSTMHGCPPDEIEKIGLYLIEQRKLQTTIKLNPTLNGADDLRYLLNEHLGFEDVVVPDLAFDHDLKYADSVKLITTLKERAKEVGVDFSIKLTNTLETQNHKDNFDKTNEMMYMSGRPLHVLAINLAKKLQDEFAGELDITFSAGIDAFNVAATLKTGIKPITVCTDLLKPGGYERFKQYFFNIDKSFKDVAANSIEEFVLKSADTTSLSQAKLTNINNYKLEVLASSHYKKSSFPWKTIKTETSLNYYDCISAPCATTCPTHQDIPSYMHLTTTGEYKTALEVIRYSNPFPYTTGLTCDHVCEDRCTRMNYDETLQIREIKRFLAFQEESVQRPVAKADRKEKIAIIGGGPSGLSCAYYMRMEGFQVEIFEAKDILGGMCSLTLPDFRTGVEGVQKDIDRILNLGITLHENHPISSKAEFSQLQQEFDYIYLAIGAQYSKSLGIPNEEHQGVVGFLDFLEQVKRKQLTSLPKNVLVIGGGNSAIDTVRTAKRLLPKDGKVAMVYRRTPKEMPAAREEVEQLLEENIEIIELTAPVEILTKQDRVTALRCQKMELIKEDGNPRGRLSPIEGSEFDIAADYIIKAIGQDVKGDFLDLFNRNSNGTVAQTVNHLSSLANVYVGGDIFHGPKSIIQAIADGKEVAWHIAEQLGVELDNYKKHLKGLTKAELKSKKRERLFGYPLPTIALDKRDNFDLVVETLSEKQAQEEASRCLLCDEICDVCVSVCPNRANLGYEQSAKSFALSNLKVEQGKVTEMDSFFYSIKQEFQTLNVGDFCNECGNCATFCPTAGRPYVDKPKIYLSKETFDAEKQNAFMFDGETLHAKIENHRLTIKSMDEFFIVTTREAVFRIDQKDLGLISVDSILEDGTINMQVVADAVNIFDFYQNHPYYSVKY